MKGTSVGLGAVVASRRFPYITVTCDSQLLLAAGSNSCQQLGGVGGGVTAVESRTEWKLASDCVDGAATVREMALIRCALPKKKPPASCSAPIKGSKGYHHPGWFLTIFLWFYTKLTVQ